MKYIATTFDGREFPVNVKEGTDPSQLLDSKFINVADGILATSSITTILPGGVGGAERKNTEMKRKGFRIEIEETLTIQRDKNGEPVKINNRVQADVVKKYVWKRSDEIILLTKEEIKFHFGKSKELST